MRRTSGVVLAGYVLLAACAADDVDEPGTAGGDHDGVGGAGEGDGTGDGTTDEPRSPEIANPPLEPGYVPSFDSLGLRCKLISDRHMSDPSANNPHGRANVRGADLGIPVVHGDDLYVFFGDTPGVSIWPFGVESLPDGVGYSAAGYQAVADDPSVLCDQLRFLRVNGAAGDVPGDFAAAHMTPPPGRPIGEFIHFPSGPHGAGLFPHLPGDFEVPTGALSHDGSIYLFYSIIDHNPFGMEGAYLARWTEPSTTGTPNYQILHHVDQRFTPGGPLGGHFINIAPVVVDEWLYLYGTGQYRASPVHLARKPLADLEQEGGYERFDAASGTWMAGDAPGGAPVVPVPHVGELSVRYFAEIGRYVMFNQEWTPAHGNQLVTRFAEAPEGPWSDPIPVATAHDPGFVDRFCCDGTDCSGEGLFECWHAGFYGTYMLPDLKMNADGSFEITFTVSTWAPYNVALMSATFR